MQGAGLNTGLAAVAIVLQQMNFKAIVPKKRSLKYSQTIKTKEHASIKSIFEL